LINLTLINGLPRHLSEWKNKNWLVLLSTTSTKGGKKFSYSLSNKSHEKLLMMCKKFVEEYKIKESLLQKVKINLDKVLNKEQKTKLYSEIERFFIDFFE